MTRAIVFLHGWGGDPDSFGHLPHLLRADGRQVEEIHLARFRPGFDELGIEDLALALDTALAQQRIPLPIDLVAHSTGALVARAWILQRLRRDRPAGVARLILAAPALLGSRLARWGQALPWDWGNRILEALELGSQATWKQALEWHAVARRLDDDGVSVHWLHGLRNRLDLPGPVNDLAHRAGVAIPAFEEAGGDGVVRLAAANPEPLLLDVDARGQASLIATRNRSTCHLFPRRGHGGSRHGILGAIRTRHDLVYRVVRDLLGDPSPVTTRPMEIPRRHRFALLLIRVVDTVGQSIDGFVPRFFFGRDEERSRLRVRHRHANGAIHAFHLELRELGRVSRFGFRLLPGRRGELSWGGLPPVDLHHPERGIDLLQPARPLLIEARVRTTVSERAFRLETLG